ncbi:hypothetical protein J6590_064952 [Homalodisca vitripennis]|nr:hypothetical protein J6590_064952 [Homalodisca vitripennis]
MTLSQTRLQESDLSHVRLKRSKEKSVTKKLKTKLYIVSTSETPINSTHTQHELAVQVLDTNCQYKYTARTASTSTQHELPVQVHGKNCQYNTVTEHELPVHVHGTNYQYTYTVRTASTRSRHELPVQHELSVQLLSTICQYKYSARTSSTSTQYELPVHVHGTNCKYRMAEATGQNDRESAYNAATVEMLEPKCRLPCIKLQLTFDAISRK